jgi:hypothetical protein
MRRFETLKPDAIPQRPRNSLGGISDGFSYLIDGVLGELCGGAIYTDGGNDLATVIKDGCPYAAYADFFLFVVHSITSRSNLAQLISELPNRTNRVLVVTNQALALEDALEFFLGDKSQ